MSIVYVGEGARKYRSNEACFGMYGVMNMLNIAICDDEERSVSKIEYWIHNFLNKRRIKHFVDKFSLGTELLKSKNLKEYHVIFLDIKMNGMDGLETAEQIRIRNEKVEIVFVSAFIKYSTKGYRFDAFRYILKEELENSLIECMESLLEKLKIETKKMTFRFNGEGEVEVYLKQIRYIESYKHLLNFYMVKADKDLYCMYNKLDNIEAILKDYGFLRIRKSQLVNMAHIDFIRSSQVILNNGKELIIPEKWCHSVRDEYLNYRGKKI